MFKLEDVAMGIWVDEMKKGGLPVRYETDERIHIDGLVVFYSQNKVESDHSRQSSSTYSHKTTIVISNGKGK